MSNSRFVIYSGIRGGRPNAASLAAATLFLLAGFSAGIAQQPPPTAASDGATTVIERRSLGPRAQADANRFETRQGRQQAQPLDWNATVGQRRDPAAAGQTAPGAQGAETPQTVPGGQPNPRAESEGRRLHPGEWRRLGRPSGGQRGQLDLGPVLGTNIQLAGSPDIFTQYCENCPNLNINSPRAAIGKLFSNAGTCSASVISGNNIIVTAAHCCWNRSTNNWIGGWTFAPAFHNGNTPFGTFTWSTARVLNSWINNGDRASDVCLIRLANDRAGRGVTFYTGWLGRSWDWGSIQEHHAVGYPGNLGGANTLQLCTSESFSPGSSCGGGGVLNTGCSMTFGASGGPWIRNYRGANWVNSVVSGHDNQSCTGTFGQTFNGPRFTSANIVTLCNAEGC